MEDESAGRVPLGRKIWAVSLGLAILAVTYVLFDPDLGTPAPLFGEITCRGDLLVTATDAEGNAVLHVPTSGVKFNATHEGELRHVYAMLWLKHPGGEWIQDQELNVANGADIFFLPDVRIGTEAYVEARDIAGDVCSGRSATLRAT